MKFFNKILIWIVSLVVVAALIVLLLAVAWHFVRAYERSTAQRPEVSVTIPPGSTIYDIDRILSGAGVLQPGEFIAAASSSEGKLFPDTYDFYLGASTSSVVQKFLDNFNAKAGPLFSADPQDAMNTLIIASIVQKEVASSTDQAIVAGILEKRLAIGMPLDVDASICYIKEQLSAIATSTAASSSCYPLSAADFRIKSPYNTYLYKGLPPGPIGNPGAQAIEATLHPQLSPYFYYLSDPKTGATIYAVTLQQQEQNEKKYL